MTGCKGSCSGSCVWQAYTVQCRFVELLLTQVTPSGRVCCSAAVSRASGWQLLCRIAFFLYHASVLRVPRLNSIHAGTNNVWWAYTLECMLPKLGWRTDLQGLCRWQPPLWGLQHCELTCVKCDQ